MKTVRPPQKQLRLLIPLVIVASAVVWAGCRTTPITNRRQFVIIPEKQEVAMGETAYREILEKETLSTNQWYVELVNRVGRRIAAVAGRPDFDWEFQVIASDQQNAFALPGGKVAVYEGIIPVCESEAGLAVVMSHEIAHALARHGGERMSQTAAAKVAGQIVKIGSKDYDKGNQKLILAAYGAASQYGVLLPYSRKHESEADAIGILLMARAGYDPREAPKFWQRFAQSHDGEQQPELLSTHPSDERRSENLQELLPRALEEYAAATANYGLGEQLD